VRVCHGREYSVGADRGNCVWIGQSRGGSSGWSVTNGELITDADLYLNANTGSATVQARINQPSALGGTVLSNTVVVVDTP